MIKRQCIECGSELVMAYRPSGIEPIRLGALSPATQKGKWRCSTCGHSYTAEELRADVRANAKAIAQA